MKINTNNNHPSPLDPLSQFTSKKEKKGLTPKATSTTTTTVHQPSPFSNNSSSSSTSLTPPKFPSHLPPPPPPTLSNSIKENFMQPSPPSTSTSKSTTSLLKPKSKSETLLTTSPTSSSSSLAPWTQEINDRHPRFLHSSTKEHANLHPSPTFTSTKGDPSSSPSLHVQESRRTSPVTQPNSLTKKLKETETTKETEEMITNISTEKDMELKKKKDSIKGSKSVQSLLTLFEGSSSSTSLSSVANTTTTATPVSTFVLPKPRPTPAFPQKTSPPPPPPPQQQQPTPPTTTSSSSSTSPNSTEASPPPMLPPNPVSSSPFLTATTTPLKPNPSSFKPHHVHGLSSPFSDSTSLVSSTFSSAFSLIEELTSNMAFTQARTATGVGTENNVVSPVRTSSTSDPPQPPPHLLPSSSSSSTPGISPPPLLKLSFPPSPMIQELKSLQKSGLSPSSSAPTSMSPGVLSQWSSKLLSSPITSEAKPDQKHSVSSSSTSVGMETPPSSKRPSSSSSQTTSPTSTSTSTSTATGASTRPPSTHVSSSSHSNLPVSVTSGSEESRKRASLLPPLSFSPSLSFSDSFSFLLTPTTAHSSSSTSSSSSLSSPLRNHEMEILTLPSSPPSTASPLPGTFVSSTPSESSRTPLSSPGCPTVSPNEALKKEPLSAPSHGSSSSSLDSSPSILPLTTSTPSSVLLTHPLSPSSIPQEVPIKLDSTQPKSGFTRFFRQPSKPTLSSDPVPSTSMMSSTPKSIPSMPLNLNLNSSPMVPLFGGSLTQLIVHDTLPPFILDCLHVLSTKGKDVQGLYRVSGHSPSIQRLKHHCYDTSRRWMEEDEDIHVISGTFKLFLRELKEPVFPFALYPTFIQLGKERNQDVRLPLLKHWIRQLPRSHLVMAKHLFLHLNALEKSKELTKMDATNLSIVFGPNLLRPQIDTMETILNADAQNLIIKDLILEAEHWCHDWLDEGGQ